MKQRGRLPSVTEVLAAVGLSPDFPMPADRRAYYLARGAALHAAIQYDTEGALDDATVHPDIAPGLDAFRKFVAETGYVTEASEIELVSDRWGFMGHPDTVGRLNGQRALLDFKYTESVDLFAGRLQLAGYSALWRECRPQTPITLYALLQLTPSGTYRVHPIEASRHEQEFLAALIVARLHQERRKAA